MQLPQLGGGWVARFPLLIFRPRVPFPRRPFQKSVKDTSSFDEFRLHHIASGDRQANLTPIRKERRSAAVVAIASGFLRSFWP
jgi:hypothetical protein